MSERYTLYDFTESLDSIDPASIARVLAAWGEQGSYAQWTGGFLLEMKDGRYAYVDGWCDTTGWGCQDGRSETWFDSRPSEADLPEKDPYDERPPMTQWGDDPADLNRYIRLTPKEREEEKYR